MKRNGGNKSELADTEGVLAGFLLNRFIRQ